MQNIQQGFLLKSLQMFYTVVTFYIKYLFSVSGSNNVGELFNMAGQVGKAVGSLVTVMTDDNGDAIVDDNNKH
jgi:hypothetical protein